MIPSTETSPMKTKSAIIGLAACGLLFVAACGPTRTHIRTETVRTEEVVDEKIVDPGSPTTATNSSGGSADQTSGSPSGGQTTTDERVIREEPAIR